jgi:sugar/nucleoside kinase (ribokinase family)
MKLNAYAFGSALMDIQVHIKDSFLDEIGVDKGNMYLTERDRQKEVLKKITGTEVLALDQVGDKLQTAAGGSAANTAFGITQLNGRAGLCGKVAGDSFGTLYERDMRDSGVLFTEKKVNGMTGTCIVLISDDTQRTMLTCLGVSSEIAYEDVDEDQLKQSSYIYLEGYLFDSELATRTLLQAIDTAKKNDVKIALTASDPFCVSRHKEIFLKLIKNDIDLLFANAQEAQALTGKDGNDEAVKALAEMCENVAVTDGEKGSILSFNGRVIKVEPFIVTSLDTTGAGDAYAAGLLFGLTNRYTLEDSGKIASFFASRVVSQIGPRYSGDIRKEMISLRLG